jgi:hypothetical protein
MTAIASINIASATASNWLAEAQSALIASQNAGGLMGTLQAATGGADGSIKTFLANSQNNANAFASIAQNTVQAAGQFYAQVAAAQGQQAAQDRRDQLNAWLNPPNQANSTPPQPRDPVVYYDNGSSLDIKANILTMSDGSQIDTRTGLPYLDPKTIVRMANGAYLDTKKSILHEPDGTQIDVNTGLPWIKPTTT